MSAANQNTHAFNAQFPPSKPNSNSDYWSNNQETKPDQITEMVSESVASNDNSFITQFPEPGKDQGNNQSKLGTSASVAHKMNWQRVALKLREYNRRLLKKVFRLEQELAEIDNKFNKYLEKSQNSDLLLGQQAEEIKQYQEKITLLTQQLATSQQQVERQELLVQQISEKQELAEKQTAQLERECALLQERYNHQVFELTNKEQASQELQNQLAQQQQTIERQEAELKRYQSAANLRQEKAIKQQKSYPHNRFIQPWSTTTIPEPRIALPRNKALPTKAKGTSSKTLEPTKTAAEIATWSERPRRQSAPPTLGFPEHVAGARSGETPRRLQAQGNARQDTTGLTLTSSTSSTSNNQGKKPQPVKSTSTKKPQSLAAVDLPTFPRPQ